MLFACATALAAVLGASAAQAQTYNRLVVFGDSLSDNGNTFLASGGTNPPSPPYFQGRFSNGPTFTELLGFGTLGRGAAGAVAGNVNYAFGGAETTGPGTFGVPSLRQQLQLYTSRGGTFGANDLVSVYAGANNILNNVQAASVNPNPPAFLGGISTVAANDVLSVAGQVAAAGAGTIIVPNLPGFGDLPPFRGGPASQLVEMFGSGTFNARIAAGLPGVAQANANTNFILVDVDRAVAQIRANPTAYGFTNVTTPCLNSTTGAVCATPDTFFYWDNIHPTAALHRAFAAVVTDYISYGSRGAATALQAEAALDHRESAFDATMDMLGGSHRIAGGPELTLSIESAESTEDQRGNVPESERNTTSVRAGVIGRVRPDTVAGLMASAATSEAKAGGLGFDARSLGVDFYVGWGAGALFVNAVGGGSADEYSDIRRTAGFGSTAQTAHRVTGSSIGGKVQAGWRMDMGGGVALSPRAALSATRVEVDPYNEEGFSARHAIAAREVEATGAEASVRLDVPFMGLNGRLEAGYGDYLSYDGDVAVALVNNPAKPIVTSVDAPGRGMLVNAGLEGRVFGGWGLGLGYRGRFDEGSDSHAALLSLTLRR
jgi:outer membrane lipase/esterase